MSRIRSPGYPSISLREAIDLAEKIFDRNRLNAIDREAAMKDMGYSGVTGHSSKMIADLSHYGLVEKAGKGGVRVTDLAARILHAHNLQERTEALQEAAYNPSLFDTIRGQWPDGRVSENSLRSYFMRNGFASAALAPALRAYIDTHNFLQQENATESHRQAPSDGQESKQEGERLGVGRELVPVREEPAQASPPLPERAQVRSGVDLMAGERVVFVEEGEATQYLKLIANGDINADMLEALEDFVKRQKRRLERAQSAPSVEATS